MKKVRKQKKIKIKEQYLIPRIPPVILYLIMMVWGYYVLKNYYTAYPHNVNIGYLNWLFSFGINTVSLSFRDFFIRAGTLLKSILITTAYLFAAREMGQLIMNKVFPGTKIATWGEDIIIYVGMGLSAIMILNIFLGFLGIFYKILVMFVLLTGVILNRIHPKKTIKYSPFFNKEKLNVMDYCFLGLMLLSLSITVIGALVPETFYDSLKYHLAMPSWWNMIHKVSTYKYFAMSYYPYNLHTVYANILMFGDEIAVKLFHFSFELLSILSIIHISRKYFSIRTGLIAAAIFSTVPIVMMVGWRSAIEMGLTYYETLTVLCVLNYMLDDTEKSSIKNWLIMAGIFCGIAVGSKIISLYCFVIMLVLITYKNFMMDFPESNTEFVKKAFKTLKTLIFFSAVVVSVASPWYIRTGIQTGNPLYPTILSPFRKEGDFLKHVIKDETVEISDPGKPERSIKNIITLPWNLTMGKKTQEPFSGAVYLILLPFLFLLRKPNRPLKILIIYFALYYIIWVNMRAYLRYFISAFSVGCIVLACYINESKIKTWFKNVICIVLVFMGCTNVIFVAGVQKISLLPFMYISGFQSKKEYLSTRRPSSPSPYYETISWANDNLPEDSKILFMGECRGYYSKKNYIAQTIADLNPLNEWIKTVENEKELYELLKENNVTHIFLNVPEAKRLSSYAIMQFDKRGLKIFSSFWDKYIKEIHKSISDIAVPMKNIYSVKKEQPEIWNNYSRNIGEYVYLYEIMTEEEANRAHVIPYNFFLSPIIYSKKKYTELIPAIEELRKVTK